MYRELPDRHPTVKGREEVFGGRCVAVGVAKKISCWSGNPFVRHGLSLISLKMREEIVDFYSEGGIRIWTANSAVAFCCRGEAGLGGISALVDWKDLW